MTDIDELEKLVKTVTSGAAAQKSTDPVIRNMGRLEYGDACKQYLRATNPAAILALIAELRAFRAEAVAHEAFVNAFNAECNGYSPQERVAHDNLDAASTASRPYKQAAIDAARGAK